MVSDSGKTVSPWFATVEMPPCPALNQDISVDVCIVGAGIAGLTTAYLLTREGKRVAVLEDGQIGAGETGRTTAHLVNALDDRFYKLERLHGERGIRLAAESHSAAIDKVEEIVQTERMQCDFMRLDGYLFEPSDGDPKDLETERDACLKAGLNVELVTRAPAPFDTGPALKFPRRAVPSVEVFARPGRRGAAGRRANLHRNFRRKHGRRGSLQSENENGANRHSSSYRRRY
jgi:hypothetical protein